MAEQPNNEPIDLRSMGSFSSAFFDFFSPADFRKSHYLKLYKSNFQILKILVVVLDCKRTVISNNDYFVQVFDGEPLIF